MTKAMTVRELRDRLNEVIAAGDGDAVVFAAIDDLGDIDAAMQESHTNWTPARFELTPVEITGRYAPMLVIGHASCDWDD